MTAELKKWRRIFYSLSLHKLLTEILHGVDKFSSSFAMTAELKKWRRTFYSLSLHLK